jgi:hypothetical protein
MPGGQNSSFGPGRPNPLITLGYPQHRAFIHGGVDGGAGSVSYYLDGGIGIEASQEGVTNEFAIRNSNRQNGVP